MRWLTRALWMYAHTAFLRYPKGWLRNRHFQQQNICHNRNMNLWKCLEVAINPNIAVWTFNIKKRWKWVKHTFLRDLLQCNNNQQYELSTCQLLEEMGTPILQQYLEKNIKKQISHMFHVTWKWKYLEKT